MIASLCLLVPSSALADERADEIGDEATAPAALDKLAPPRVVDVTVGQRDDSFTGISHYGDRVWVATAQGRVYESRDNGQQWSESTVLSERKELFQTPGVSSFLGSLRKGSALSLSFPTRLGRTIERGQSPTSIENRPQERFQSFLKQPRLRFSGNSRTGLEAEAANAAGTSNFVLIGSAARAPRLAATLRRRRLRSAARRTLATTVRGTAPQVAINRVVEIGDQVFALTRRGLYRALSGETSWVRVYSGQTRNETDTRILKSRPGGLLYLGTRGGLFVSRDGGDSFSKVSTMPGIPINGLRFGGAGEIYVSTTRGLYRSNDGGASFRLIYTSTLPIRRNVRWLELDPHRAGRAYVATADGLFVTDNIKTASQDDWRILAGLRAGNLIVPFVASNPRRPGHLYMMTRANLPNINYGANGPESYLLESEDYGKSWRLVMSGRTQGTLRDFWLDSRNPDHLWVAWSRAIVRVDRGEKDADSRSKNSATKKRAAAMVESLNAKLPPMSSMISAALTHHGVSVHQVQKKLSRLNSRSWLPSRISLSAQAQQLRVGGVVNDLQLGDERFLRAQDTGELRIMVWLTWSLPGLVHDVRTAPMSNRPRHRVVDAVRQRLIQTVHRNYGELKRLTARDASSKKQDLYSRTVRRLRQEQLSVLVDAATGGYLTKHTGTSPKQKTRKRP